MPGFLPSLWDSNIFTIAHIESRLTDNKQLPQLSHIAPNHSYDLLPQPTLLSSESYLSEWQQHFPGCSNE